MAAPTAGAPVALGAFAQPGGLHSWLETIFLSNLGTRDAY
jgi:hypothetical protein